MMSSRTCLVAVLSVVMTCGAAVRGDTVVLTPDMDNTLYENGGGSFSNGSGAHFFAGRTDDGLVRRGLVLFAVASFVPAGATIESATVRLNMTRTQSDFETVTLHRTLAAWGEGLSNAGSAEDGFGALSANGDATWIHRFFSAVFWLNWGGDFVSAPSAGTTVGDPGFYTWGSTPGLVADVQHWLDQPDENFGWLVRGNEGGFQTTKRFATKEHPVSSFRPILTIQFTPPGPVQGDFDGDGDVDLIDFEAFLDCVGGPEGDPPPDCETFDFDVDADVDLHDAGALQRAFTG